MKHVIFQDKKIFYRVLGEGNPVMLVHGFAEDGRVWDYQADALKDAYKLVIPDLPGSGTSEMLEGEVHISDYADAIKAIWDTEIKNEGDTFTLIGHSMGGYVSLAFAQKYGDLLNGLGLFHSSAYADDEEKKATRKKGIAFINKNGAASFLKNTSPNLFSDMTKNESPELVEQLIELSTYFTEASLTQYYEAMIKRPDRTGVLGSFSKPVLIIQGMYDNAVPLQAGLEQSYMPPISFFHILNKSGHMGMWEENSASNKFLTDYLKSVQP